MFALMYDTSLLDSRTVLYFFHITNIKIFEGITFRGYSISEIAEFLPKSNDGQGADSEGEGIFYFLY